MERLYEEALEALALAEPPGQQLKSFLCCSFALHLQSQKADKVWHDTRCELGVSLAASGPAPASGLCHKAAKAFEANALGNLDARPGAAQDHAAQAREACACQMVPRSHCMHIQLRVCSCLQ